MPLLDIARLGGIVNFGEGQAGSITVPYTFFNGTLSASSYSAQYSVPANFDNLTIVLKRPNLSNGTQVVLQTRVGTGTWADIGTVNLLASGTVADFNSMRYQNSYLYDMSILHTRGTNATVFRRRLVRTTLAKKYGGLQGEFQGLGTFSPDGVPGVGFDPWHGSAGNISVSTTINHGVEVTKNNTYALRFGIAGYVAPPPVTPAADGSLDITPAVFYSQDSINSGGDNSAIAQAGNQNYVAIFFARHSTAGSSVNFGWTRFTGTTSEAPGSNNVDYETMSTEELNGYENLVSEGDIYSYGNVTRYFRLKNPAESPVVAHFFASRYTCKQTADKSTAAYFSSVTVNPWGRLEIARLSDVRINGSLIVNEAVSYVDATDTGTITRWYPSGLVCDYEGDRRSDQGALSATTGPNAGSSSGSGGGGGGGYATIGANGYGPGNGGAVRTQGPQNVSARLVHPNTIVVLQDAVSLGFRPGQGIKKIAGSGTLYSGAPTIKSIQNTIIELTDPHESVTPVGQTITISAFDDDLGILYSPALGLSAKWLDKLQTKHCGGPGANGSEVFYGNQGATELQRPMAPGRGGSGGGTVKIIAANIMLNGRIWSIGASGGQGKPASSSSGNGGGGGGGGSGGTIWIIAVNLAGGHGTTNVINGITYPPGLGPMCMYDHVYWNVPDLNSYRDSTSNTSAGIPVVSRLAEYAHVSGNISVNGGEGGGAGHPGSSRPYFRHDVWTDQEGDLAPNVSGKRGWISDSGSGEAPYSASDTIGYPSSPAGVEHRYWPLTYWYLTPAGLYKTYKTDDVPKGIEVNVDAVEEERDAQGTITTYAVPGYSYWEPDGTQQITVPDKIYANFSLETATVVYTGSGADIETSTHSSVIWRDVLPVNNEATASTSDWLAAKAISEVTNIATIVDGAGISKTYGGVGSTGKVYAFSVGSGISINGTPTGRSLGDIEAINGVTGSPWKNYLTKSYLGAAVKVSAALAAAATWSMGQGAGGLQGGCGGPGSAGRIRIDVGTLYGWNPNGIRVTADPGTLSGNTIFSGASYIASWPSGYPQSGTAYPSLDPSKWYDPANNRTYPGNGPLWEV